jgi:hypothetical protein
MSRRDRETVRDNIEEIKNDPKLGHPSSLRSASPGAWQHNCPHSFVMIYKWDGECVSVECVVDRYG